MKFANLVLYILLLSFTYIQKKIIILSNGKKLEKCSNMVLICNRVNAFFNIKRMMQEYLRSCSRQEVFGLKK